MAYSSKVIDHYENPRNIGSLPKNDPNVGTGLVGVKVRMEALRQPAVRPSHLQRRGAASHPQGRVGIEADSLRHGLDSTALAGLRAGRRARVSATPSV